MDGFEADDARIVVIFDDIIRSFVDFFESTLKHSLPDIHLFFHALGWERVSGVWEAREHGGMAVNYGGVW